MASQSLLPFKGVSKPPRFNSKKARKAHWRLSWKKYKEPKLAQQARRPWGMYCIVTLFTILFNKDLWM